MATNFLSSDRPIESADEDQLGFQPFAASLAKGVRGMVPSDGLVVALHAPWGSGKTSALNLIARHLAVLDIAALVKQPVETLMPLAAARADANQAEECERARKWQDLLRDHQQERQTIVVRFNPWYFSGQESIFKAFFGVLGTELSVENDSPIAKAAAAILKRGAEAGAAIGTLAGGFVAGPAGAATGAVVSGLFGRLANDQFDTTQSLEATLARLRKALRDSDKHIIVFIDDIDRLMPDELRQMLTLLKSLGNLPRVTYILAYDRDEVVRILKYAKINNHSYMEKIVQVSFDLPKIDRHALRSLLFSRLDSILKGGTVGDERRWGLSYYSYIDPYISKPRHVAQLGNALHIIWPSVQPEVDWSDLCVLQTLRLHEPATFQMVLDNLDKLTGEERHWGDDKEWAKPFEPSKDNSTKPEIAREALVYLFPRLAKAWQKLSRGSSDEQAAKRARRLCCSEYTANYFSLSPSPDQFSSSQIQSLFSADHPGEALTRLLELAQSRKTRKGSTLVSRLLEQIMEEASAGTAMPVLLARSLLVSSDIILRTKDTESGPFAIDNPLRLSWVFVNTLRRIPSTERANYLRSCFDGTRGIAFIVPFIETMTGGGAQDSGEEIIPQSDHAQLRSDALALLMKASSDPDFLKLPQCGRILWTWVRLSDEKTVSAWLLPKLGDDATIIDLAEAMSSEGWSSNEGQYYSFAKDAWSKIINVEEFLARYEAVAASAGNEPTATATISKFNKARMRK
jgi:predicted KAP-like P-loop ATPase